MCGHMHVECEGRHDCMLREKVVVLVLVAGTRAWRWVARQPGRSIQNLLHRRCLLFPWQRGCRDGPFCHKGCPGTFCTLTLAACLPRSRPQKRNLGPAAQALEAPAEWEDGLLVDPDVQQETDKMRGRARRYVGAGFDSSAGALSEAEGELVGGAAAARGAGGAAPAAVPAAGEGRRVIHLEARCVGPPTAPAPLAPAVAGSPPAGQHPSKEGLQGTASGAAQRQYAVEMYGMRKVFRRRGSLLRSRPFVAVRGNWLGIYEGGFRGWQATGIAAVPAAGHSAAGLGLPLLRLPKSWAGCACVPACTLRH